MSGTSERGGGVFINKAFDFAYNLFFFQPISATSSSIKYFFLFAMNVQFLHWNCIKSFLQFMLTNNGIPLHNVMINDI